MTRSRSHGSPHRIRGASTRRDEAAPAQAAGRDARAPTHPAGSRARRRVAHSRRGPTGIREDGCCPYVARPQLGRRRLGDARRQRQRSSAVLDLCRLGRRPRTWRPWPRRPAAPEDPRRRPRERGDRARERRRETRSTPHGRAGRLPVHHRSPVPRVDRLRTRAPAADDPLAAADADRPVTQSLAAAGERCAYRGPGERPRIHERRGERATRRTGRACSRARRGRGAPRANGGLAGRPLPRVALATRRREPA